MNIFQRIKEVKLPFIAVIAALAFGGVVAPANAAVPTASNFVTSNLTYSSATVSFDMSVATASGIGCKVLGRAAAAAAPTAAEILAATSYNQSNGDLTAFSSNVSNPNSLTSGNISFNGLTASTNYVVYVACQDGASQSSVFSHSFTTAAAASVITPTSFSGTASAGQTLTATAATFSVQASPSRYWVSCGSSHQAATGTAVNSVLSDCLPIFESLTAYNTYRNSSTTTPLTFTIANDGTAIDYNGQSVNLAGRNITFYESVSGARTTAATVLFGGSSAPTPSVTETVRRPLPQINFAVSTAPGASARPTGDTRKGTLSIEGSNLSDLTSITIGGKAATFSVKDGKLEIKIPAGVTGFPEVVMTNSGGSITMQNAIEIYAPKVQKLTQLIGDRFTVAGTEALENAYINSKDATALEAFVVVAPDATEAEIAKAVKAATKAVNYIDKVGKRIVRTAVTVVKTGAAGTKPSVEMSFTK